MRELSLELLSAHRARTYCIQPDLRLRTAEDAVSFVNERGYIFFWPIKGIELPSLWVAAAGDRPVPDEHDDPGHITWDWKDSLLGKKRWYYGRILRHRNTILSLEDAAYFYALSPNFGDPENDYLEAYEQGRLTMEARLVYEALLREGPLDTLALRKAARLSSESSTGRFDQALGRLQEYFMVLPVGSSSAGAWHYAFVYDLTVRHFPDLPERARFIQEKSARQRLIRDYFSSVGAAPRASAGRLFGWNREDIENALCPLIEDGDLVDQVLHPERKGEFLSLSGLITEQS